MSDSDSDDFSPARDAHSSTRLSDFPLTTNRLFTVLRHEINVLLERIDSIITPIPDSFSDSSTGTTIPARNQPLLPPVGGSPHFQPRLDFASTGRTDIDPLPMAPPIAGPKQPVVTLVSALAPTSYGENKEADRGVRTIAYVKVQRSVLQYLETKASDSLSVKQARHWTRSIDETRNKTPNAKDALRLSYYMRAQGFDVYVRFENNDMLLYIVKQTSNDRGKDTDALY
jgi:hypothetical protein